MAEPNEQMPQGGDSTREAQETTEQKEAMLKAMREAKEVTLAPVDGPVAEDGPERSAEVGIEDVIEEDEAEDPAVTGAAILRTE